jgi:hypothetical protein
MAKRPAYNHAALASFVRGYISCALWTATDENGTPFDHIGLDESDLTREAREIMTADCARFLNANWSDLVAALSLPFDCAGHDYWLTRNHHGAGFWDRGLGDVGQRLTEAAHADGEQGLYIGSDGRIYV